MHNGRLNCIAEAMAEHPLTLKNAAEYRIYFRRADSWHQCSTSATGPSIGDSIVPQVVTACDGHKRTHNKKEACFPQIDDVRIYVRYKTKPTEQTLAQTEDAISRCIKNAQRIYTERYDPLTRLLNRASFAEARNKTPTPPTPPHGSNNSTASPAQPSLAIVYADIDDFKLVNDAHGQDAGDLAIQHFAQALSRASLAATGFTATAYRIGGEEFAIICNGDITIQGIKKIREDVIIWVENNKNDLADSIARTSPTKTPVVLRASFGCSRITPLSSTNVSTIATLVTEADRAKARAKRGGKDRLYFFHDIKAKHWRVHEYHAATGVTCIDIGTDVGVKIGDEFQVYHPSFYTQSTFSVSDGRTTVAVGKYPFHASALVTVIQVQANIAFCTTTKAAGNEPIVAGGFLTANPDWSLDHRFPKSSVIPTTRDAAADAMEGEAFIVCKLRDSSEQGTTAKNEALALLYSAMSNAIPGERIRRVKSEPIMFATVPPNADVKAVAVKIRDIWAGQAQPGSACGVAYVESSHSTALQSKGQRQHFSLGEMLATAASFDTHACYSTIDLDKASYSLRRTGTYSECIKLHSAASHLGLDSDVVANNAALSAALSAPPNFDLALKLLKRISDHNQEVIYRANFAATLAMAERYSDSLVQFDMIAKSIPPAYATLYLQALVKTGESAKAGRLPVLKVLAQQARAAANQVGPSYESLAPSLPPGIV